jgi:predicted ATPase
LKAALEATMIERLYIDNFRTLVNFEWKPGSLALLLGENGTGKTSVFDVVFGLRGIISGEDGVRRSFSKETLTRWDTRLRQRFEMDAQVDGLGFRYRLTIEHHAEDRMRSRIVEESLMEGERVLVRFENGDLHLHRDDGSPGPTIVSDWGRSAVGTIAEGRDNKKLTTFKRWFHDRVWFLQPDPRRMSQRTDQVAEMLDVDLGNLASWYPTWLAENLDGAVAFRDELRAILPDFESLVVDPKTLKLVAKFSRPDGGKDYKVAFDELSDGQRQLFALYLIRHAIVRDGYLVLVDEPDNYVALREIQPWLADVTEAALSNDGPQVWLISHHPELLDQLAPAQGVRFFLENGPTRIEPFRGLPGLTSAEVVARGWDGE